MNRTRPIPSAISDQRNILGRDCAANTYDLNSASADFYGGFDFA